MSSCDQIGLSVILLLPIMFALENADLITPIVGHLLWYKIFSLQNIMNFVIPNNLGGMPLGWTEIYPTLMNEEFAIELPRAKADYDAIRILVTYNGASCSLSID